MGERRKVQKGLISSFDGPWLVHPSLLDASERVEGGLKKTKEPGPVIKLGMTVCLRLSPVIRACVISVHPQMYLS